MTPSFKLDDGKLLHHPVMQACRIWPNRTAILSEDGSKLSYGDLHRSVESIAGFLRSKLKIGTESVGPDYRRFVGVMSSVCSESIQAVLGILRAGACYVPLDEFSPSQRLAPIIKNLPLQVICSTARCYQLHRDLLKEGEIQAIIFLDSIPSDLPDSIEGYTLAQIFTQEYPTVPDVRQPSDDLAYILHTSGSTGIPKGIMLSHRNARTFTDWMGKEFNITEQDVVISRAPFKFDLSVFDIFTTLSFGATLVCFDWERDRDLDTRHIEYVSLLEREKATILYTTPSTLMALLLKGALGAKENSLRTIMYAGEPFPIPSIRRLQQALPNTKIANIYGPTETNIITYFWIPNPWPYETPIPLGAVVDDTEILIVSESRDRVCAPDEIGELWCRGGTVTLGYFQNPELTNACLVRSPFHSFPAWFWRTGDFGRRDKEGVLHYHGRRDHMIKIKGHRIELGEIETAVLRFPKIDEVVATPIQRGDLDTILFVFIGSKEKIAPGALLSFLSKLLPPKVLPDHIIALNTFPYTSSGKVDRMELARRAEQIISNEVRSS